MTSTSTIAPPLPSPPRGAPVIERCELEFAGYLMRPLDPEEAAILLEAVIESIDTVGRWMAWCNPAYQIEEAAGWIARAADTWSRSAAFEFGIFRRADQALVGVCGLNCIVWPNRTANLGYWIRQSAQGKGIASAAVARLARFGFDDLGLSRIEIVTAETNYGSRRVAERCGALFEAVLRNRLVVNGSAVPGALYSLIPET